MMTWQLSVGLLLPLLVVLLVVVMAAPIWLPFVLAAVRQVAWSRLTKASM